MSISTIEVLLVEDEVAHAELIRRAFLPQAHRVKLNISYSLDQARRYLDETTPNLIISDLRLPDGNGVDLLPKDAGNIAYPVVIMTSHGDEQVAVEAMKAGALDYVVKTENTLADMYHIAERALREWGHIVNRKRAEEALRASDERYRAFVGQSSEGIWRMELEQGIPINAPEDEQVESIYHYGYLAECNDAFARMYGYSNADEMVGTRTGDLAPDTDPKNQAFSLAFVRSGYRITDAESREITRDGRVIHFNNNFVGIIEGGKLVRAWGIQRDITERKRLERELLEISNREQHRIGRDLHDELGQLLTGIGFRVAELEGELRNRDLPETNDAEEIGDLVTEAIGQTRALAQGLNPVSLESGGLFSGLNALAASVELVYKVKCTFESAPTVFIDDLTMALHVYRIAQEAVNNAIKHGQASVILIRLTQDGHDTTLTIRDNGRGIPDEEGRSEGMGLRNMRYRAGMIYGILNVGPGEEGGTVVSCNFRTDLERHLFE